MKKEYKCIKCGRMDLPNEVFDTWTNENSIVCVGTCPDCNTKMNKYYKFDSAEEW